MHLMMNAKRALRAARHYTELYFDRYSKYFGTRQGLAMVALEALSKDSHEVSVSYPGLSSPLHLRTRDSDVKTFAKVFVEEEYGIPEITDVRTIVDAGANIGLASLYFARKFPKATIIALEPERRNFELLSKNLRHASNVALVNEALWSYTGSLSLSDPGDGSWSFRTEPIGNRAAPRDDSPPKVPCVSVSDLMERHGIDKIDLLKIDIEGAEKELFEHAEDWIRRVDAIAIELHDRFKRGCSWAFYAATMDFEYEVHKGENVFVMRNRVPH